MALLRSSARSYKRQASDEPATPSKKKRVKTDQPSASSPRRPKTTLVDRAAELRDRKLKSFAAHAQQSPFAELVHPTPAECVLAHDILARLHGDCLRPDKVVAPKGAAGCGSSPSVLDALVRTILSQNTSDANSSRAKRSMDAEYGGSDCWDAIVAGGQQRLQQAIKSGGLSVVKSRAILNILHQVKERHGVYSLDHLFEASDHDAMREMLSFKGVGPKTASCVLLFCLRRASFAVDTHVHRITGLLGWRPACATREEAQAHLDARVPPQEKYPLHVLIITHGKTCAECRAGGKNLGKCELRRAFGKGRLKGAAGHDVERQELNVVKKEEEEEGDLDTLKILKDEVARHKDEDLVKEEDASHQDQTDKEQRKK
ncbi:hypothetical protein CDD81_6233 [Ophiocordyceps australis]|uniref:HhH-GPD domain-containing protein n=1 Tax=Ophiocordyceps australis TaxID=1399860 RepID=A0A2C5Y7F0_9HYPO|nr:hypothetical protein CDD81_6233 [Ophiocordyceps australis]